MSALPNPAYQSHQESLRIAKEARKAAWAVYEAILPRDEHGWFADFLTDAYDDTPEYRAWSKAVDAQKAAEARVAEINRRSYEADLRDVRESDERGVWL